MIGNEHFQPVYSPDGFIGGAASEGHTLEWLVTELSRPGTIVAFNEINLPVYEKIQILKPKEYGLPFSIQLSDDASEAIRQTHAIPLLHISSKLAQAGLDIFDITYDADLQALSGRLQNVGPFTLELPANVSLAVGFPYLRSDTPIEGNKLDRLIADFNKNNNTEKKKNGTPVFAKISGLDPTPDTDFMTILTPRILIHTDYPKRLNLFKLPRGTQRRLLHDKPFLDLYTIDFDKISEEIHSNDPLKIYQYLFHRYRKGFEVAYALTETHAPINYPEGYGIEIVGGVILNKDGSPKEWVTHSASVVGQHRHDPSREKNPRHRLLSELYYKVGDLIRGVLFENKRVALVCSPVQLVWANQEI